MIIVGVDVGSTRCGIVAATEALPLHVHVADVVLVPPVKRGKRHDVQPAVDALVQRIVACKATKVIVEHGKLFTPKGKSQAAIAAISQNHEVCALIEAALYRELTAIGIDVITLERAKWAHRVVPHTSGGITDEMADEGLRTHVVEGWDLLGRRSKDARRGSAGDERDAAGVVVGYLLPAPKKARKRRVGSAGKAAAPGPRKTPEEKRASASGRLMRHRAKTNAFAGMSLAELDPAGCVCFQGRARRGGRHRARCPAAPTTRRNPKAIDPLDVLLGLEPGKGE